MKLVKIIENNRRACEIMERKEGFTSFNFVDYNSRTLSHSISSKDFSSLGMAIEFAVRFCSKKTS